MEKLLAYKGTTRVTLDGKTCLHWADPMINQSEVFQQTFPTGFPSKRLNAFKPWMAVNFCRNLNAHMDGPWCFVEGDHSIHRGGGGGGGGGFGS